jgi:hypothetical protein
MFNLKVKIIMTTQSYFGLDSEDSHSWTPF